MHHLANSMTELCPGVEHGNAGESVPMHYNSWEEAVLSCENLLFAYAKTKAHV